MTAPCGCSSLWTLPFLLPQGAVHELLDMRILCIGYSPSGRTAPVWFSGGCSFWQRDLFQSEFLAGGCSFLQGTRPSALAWGPPQLQCEGLLHELQGTNNMVSPGDRCSYSSHLGACRAVAHTFPLTAGQHFVLCQAFPKDLRLVCSAQP